MNKDNTCGHCAKFRKSDGYCYAKGTGVNALSVEDCFIAPMEEQPAPAAATKKCKDCGRELPLSDFGFHRSGHRKNICRECQGKRTHASRRTEATKNDAQSATMTDAEMVAALRGNGWTVTCTRTITEEL